MTEFLTLLPPGRAVLLPGRGETFVRDTGPMEGAKGTVLLLHGWMFPADLNWITAFPGLAAAGYRVVALDHRGHGRGMRRPEPFRLADCAEDAAIMLEECGIPDAIVVGYSMGGAIAQLMARDHRERVSGLVLGATALHWQWNARVRRTWRGMAALNWTLRAGGRRIWRRLLLQGRLPLSDEMAAWIVGELERSNVADISEAGRELGRFDSRPWARSLDVPTAVVCTTKDKLVPPASQRELHAAIPGAEIFEVAADHFAPSGAAGTFVPTLVDAIEHVRARAAGRAAGAGSESAA
jgi:pimeloyl-ACP methyl ester carboxylesterase